MFEDIGKVIKFFNDNRPEKSFVVVGDIMLDIYIKGNVKKISSEALVPIVNILDESRRLGGAGNVANNLRQLGNKVKIAGVVGNDLYAKCILDIMENNGIQSSGIRYFEEKTTVKTRVIANNQQIVRYDIESSNEIHKDLISELINWSNDNITKDIDGVILSDYGKGVCTTKLCEHIIKLCNDLDIPVFIDPKGSSWDKYRGCNFITPNMDEMEQIIPKIGKMNDYDIAEVGDELRKKLCIDNLIITRSEKGISVINNDVHTNLQADSKKAYDVVGAGDTVIATICALVSSNIGIIDAVKIANIAASIVVGKLGTTPIYIDELKEAVFDNSIDLKMKNKIMNIFGLEKKINEWRCKNEKIVFTNGCFDILHFGHVKYLREASELGHHLIIGLNSDRSVKRIKGATRPIINENDRAMMLATLNFVDIIVLFNESNPANLIKKIKPDIIVKGGDYSYTNIIGKEYSTEVRILSYESGYSTSRIIEKVLSNYSGERSNNGASKTIVDMKTQTL